MSILVERSMGELNEDQKPVLYSLFDKGPKPKPQPRDKPAQEPRNALDKKPEGTTKKKSSGRSGKRTKPAGSLTFGELDPTATAPNEKNLADLLEVDPNNGRRKRRKTASLDGKASSTIAGVVELSTGEGLQFTDRSRLGSQKMPPLSQDALLRISQADRENMKSNGANHGNSDLSEPRSESNSVPAPEIIRIDDDDTPVEQSVPVTNEISAPLPDSQGLPHPVQSVPREEPSAPKPAANLGPTKPTKVLRFNSKTGTIGSPPPKKIVLAVEQDKPTTKATRGRRPKRMLLTIRYGEGHALPSSTGQKIEQILSSPPKLPREKEVAPAKPKPPKTNPGPPKPVHPMFLGKSVQMIQSIQKPTTNDSGIIDLTGHQESAIQSRARPTSPTKEIAPRKPSVPFSGIGNTTKVVKFPGAVEPAWPWKGMIHVRGAEPLQAAEVAPSSPTVLSRVKKSKYQATRISSTENIIESLASDLSVKSVVQSIQDINPDEYPSIPQCLRVPTKHYESGVEIQKRVRKLVRTRLPLPQAAVASSSEDEVQADDVHPALLRIYKSIAASMSAFDKGQCESQAWINKYSPKSAAEVLQTGCEAEILKKWLEALTVQSVEIGSGGKTSAATKSNIAGKRKRKSKKLDDFVISTDEEDNDMDEITEPEDEIHSSNPRQAKRTVIRGKDVAALGSNIPNAVVMSGPHGCGKTAAVYAAAKELGFEVFEINPGSRRNGKDIVERVGDMTRNHQVQRSTAPPQVDGPDEDKERIDNALADDLKSGRQGTMNSFFKSQPAKSKPKPNAKEVPIKKPEMGNDENSSKSQTIMPDVSRNGIFSKISTKKQKQSLILIEEADILYKEDSQFWVTILNLVVTSKRPIIITCNDESVLPMADLKLHATIRMVPPPVDLAADYLLLVAACEGHIIKRRAAKELYERRNSDLRAAITELNFWCQFAVGDMKGGLEWYYPRWPAGNDVDEHGNVIRVVSEGTYEAGMGCLSQDFLESHIHYLDIEEETLHEACDGWGVDLGDWVQNIGMKKWAGKLRDSSNGKGGDLAALSMYADFAESMSVADVCSGSTFAPENQIALDVSFPELSLRARDDYTLAFELKDAPNLVTYNTTGKDISLYMKSRTRKILHLDQHIEHNLEVPTELDRPNEETILRLIRNRVTSPKESLDRLDFSFAFDPISSTEKYVWSTTLEASTFDRTMTLIVEDLAPYVRSIVAYDARLQRARLKLSNLMSEGGRKGKRMRTTRAAISALEGGARNCTRRDRYFTAELNSNWVLRTGMESWLDAARMETEIAEPPTSSRRSSNASLKNGREDESEGESDELEGR
ncbi:hypothetical protein BKA61DRAFT_588404 [Leptodontidium sp. MPI-SDFR-AT-0119]|nr:hypothetical protein BKA61DRAFT_588404 [Leptodontidium sp. MPI-SDFR-AT-0119]